MKRHKKLIEAARTAYHALALISIGFVIALLWVTFNPGVAAQVYQVASAACDQVAERVPKQFSERLQP